MQIGVTMFADGLCDPAARARRRGGKARLRIALVSRAQPHPDQPQVALAGRRRAAEMVLRHLRSLPRHGRRRGRHQDHQARHRRLPGGAARSHPYRQGGRHRRPAVQRPAAVRHRRRLERRGDGRPRHGVRHALQADARAHRGDEGDLGALEAEIFRRVRQVRRDDAVAQAGAEAASADHRRRRLAARRAPRRRLRRRLDADRRPRRRHARRCCRRSARC